MRHRTRMFWGLAQAMELTKPTESRYGKELWDKLSERSPPVNHQFANRLPAAAGYNSEGCSSPLANEWNSMRV